jgi:hypothetical protein
MRAASRMRAGPVRLNSRPTRERLGVFAELTGSPPVRNCQIRTEGIAVLPSVNSTLR